MTGPIPEQGRALFRRGPRDPARGAVLLLHGGTPHSYAPVGHNSGSMWRMGLLRDAIDRPLLQAGYAVWLLRYAVRGWNDELPIPSPVVDARWALDEIAGTDPGPVALIGHSMGGRTGAAVADHDSVCGLVALAPWFEPDDSPRPLAGRHLVVGHGRRDRITSARSSAEFVSRATPYATSAHFTDLGMAGHYLLYRPRMWHRFALDNAREMLER